MSVLEAFNSTWAQARAAFGDGAPDDGSPFDASGRLVQMQSDVRSASPGSRWTGTASESYAMANDSHGRVFGEIARLDRRMGHEVDRSAAVVASGRRDLDAVRGWVMDAASAVPQTVEGQRMLVPIVARGIDDVAKIVARSNGELSTVASRIDGIGAEYAALVGDDESPVPGKAVRPLDGILTDEEWRIARNSPTLLDQWAELEAKGWQVTFNSGGTYTDSQAKTINIDPSVRDRGPEVVVNSLAHEMGHALHNPPVDRSSKETFVNSRLDGEGAATLNTIKIEREILANGGPDIIPPGGNDDYFEKVYDDFLAAGSTDEAHKTAMRAIGQVYGSLHPSTAPDKTYREYYGEDY